MRSGDRLSPAAGWDDAQMTRSTIKTAVLAGVAVGAVGGVLLLEGLSPTLLLLAVYVVFARRAGQGLAGLGGILVGVGATWVVLLGWVKLSCDSTAPSATCEAPNIDAFLIIALALLVFGVGLWVLAVRRAQRG